MKKLFTLLMVAVCVVLIGKTADAQTTIAGQDFDANKSLTFTFSNGAPRNGSSGTGDRPASTTFYNSIDSAWGVSNVTSTITFANVTGLAAYTSKYVELKLSSWSISSTGNGADVGDSVVVQISTDGGTTWSSELRVAGNSNAWWAYSATGNATSTYDGNFSPTIFAPAAGGQRTTDGYSTMRVNLPDAGTQVRVRVTMVNNSANELWTIDDILVRGTPAGTPDIAISNASPSAGTINQGTANAILRAIQLDVTTATATLTGITMTTAGTYQAADLQSNSFKFWLSSSASDLTGATQLGSSQAIVTSGNNVSVSGLSQSITSGTTRYIVLTVDVSNIASTSRNISIGSTAFSNITFTSGNKTGTDPVAAGNTQTFGAVTPSIAITGVGPSAGNISIGNTNNIIYQMSFAVTLNGTELNSLTVTTGGNYQTGDLTASSFKLWYNTSNTFGTAAQIGTSQAIVASGNNVTFSGLTQSISSGTTGYVWVTVDVSSGATAGRTINITSTAFSNIVFSAGTLTGTDPAAASGAQTFAQVTIATDYFRSNVNSNSWGSYNVPGNWESSPDSTNWITSTLVPTSSAHRVIIRSGHTISLITASTTIGRIMVLNGGIFRDSINSSTIADGTDDDIIIQNGGIFSYSVNSTNPTYSGSATMRVQTGGTLQISGSGMTAANTGMNSTSIIWETGAIADYTTTNTISSSGVTYFPGATSTIPIFRMSASQTAGAAAGTTFNGVFQVANGVTMTWSGAGTKTFRNGITTNGTATMTASSTGVWAITGTTAEMGGTGGLLTLTNSNGITVPNSGTVTFSGSTTLGTTTLTGTTAVYAGTGIISLNALSQISGFSNTFGGTYYLTGTNPNVPAGTYSGLTVNGGGATLTGDIEVTGTLAINGTLTVGAHTLLLTGNSPIRTSGGIDASNTNSIVEILNGSTIDLPASLFTGNVGNFTISGSGLVTSGSSITVSNTLTLTNGFLDMGANVLTLGTSTSNVGTLSLASGTIRGSFRRWIESGNDINKIFPLDNGAGSNSRADLTFNSLTTGGTITATFHSSGAGQLPIGPNGVDRYIEAPSMHVNLIHIAPIYWTLSTGDGIDGYNYDLDLTGDGLNVGTLSVGDYRFIAVLKRHNSDSAWAWTSANHVATSGNNANPILHFVGGTSFSDFGIAGNRDNEMLPVELSGFASTVSGTNVTLNWSTSFEENNAGFDIERKSTTSGWSKIGNVAGHGTVNTPNSYTYSDRNLSSGKYSYRLKQIDYNGNYKYYELSGEVVIGTPSKYTLSQNYPNPFNPSTSISYEIPASNFVSLKVYDMMGKEVANLVNGNQEAGFYTVKFDASKLASGIYFYKLQANDFTATKKLMLLK
jgi:hypothetical protein